MMPWPYGADAMDAQARRRRCSARGGALSAVDGSRAKTGI